VLNAAVDVAVDATENPDLRCWRTMPQTCYVGEFLISPGTHNIEIHFLQKDRLLVTKKAYQNYQIQKNINLIDAYTMN
jgi:hypothetical protein